VSSTWVNLLTLKHNKLVVKVSCLLYNQITIIMKNYLFSLLLLLTFSTVSYCQIINEIDLTNNWVELYNPTSSTVDVSSLRLCKRPAYATISNLAVLAGSTLMAPGSFVVIEWSQINVNSRELGLYKSSGSYGFSTSIIDYVQYAGVASPTRAPTAVLAGVWEDKGKFVPLPTVAGNTLNNFNSAALDPTQTNSNHWWDGASTMNAENGCPTSYSMFDANQIDGVESSLADYETDGRIQSTQVIDTSAVVDYDSAIEIELLIGFEVRLSAEFLAFIDGCNFGQGGLN